MVSNFSLATLPGAWLVDSLPWLKYLPSWFPGTSFKKTARAWKKVNESVAEMPFNFTLKAMESGKENDCFVSKTIRKYLEDNPTESAPPADYMRALKWTAASLYSGGTDTSTSTLACFVLAMTMYPHVQSRAQKEIDDVIGSGRLPALADRSKLPYVDAIAKEALRWYPVVPMGFPHTVDEDIEHSGYLFPKGSMLIPGLKYFAHDAEVYHDPSSFNPERFLEPRLEPSLNSAFGFGRRVCPGRHLADASIFVVIAQLLATFTINAREGNETAFLHKREPEGTSGIISYPVAFPFAIAPRSTLHEQLVRQVAATFDWTKDDSALL